MQGKIALEEHFAIPDTLAEFSWLLSRSRLAGGEKPRA